MRQRRIRWVAVADRVLSHRMQKARDAFCPTRRHMHLHSFITSTPIKKAGGPCVPCAKAIATNSLSCDTLNSIDGGPMLAT